MHSYKEREFRADAGARNLFDLDNEKGKDNVEMPSSFPNTVI